MRLVARGVPDFDLDSVLASSGYWYLATPYTRYQRGIFHAFRHASIGAAGLIRLGVAVFSPIAHTHPVGVYGGIDPYDVEFWLKADAALMQAAHGLIVFQLPGWKESRGVTHEIKTFDRDGKPIEYLAPYELCELVKAHLSTSRTQPLAESPGNLRQSESHAIPADNRGEST